MINLFKKYLRSKKIQKKQVEIDYSHPKLKNNWKFPEVPEGYTQYNVEKRPDSVLPNIVSFDGNGRFLRLATDGERKDIKNVKPIKVSIEWPWVKGYNPKPEDWRRIGFFYSVVFDNCFGNGAKENEEQHWINKN